MSSEDPFPREPWLSAAIPEPVGELISFDCPRCSKMVEEPAYGPCESCRMSLRAALIGEVKKIDSTYEPKMNVTPNAVALKE